MAHLTMFVIFHANVIICQNSNLPHIYHIFTENLQISHMVSKHGLNYVK